MDRNGKRHEDYQISWSVEKRLIQKLNPLSLLGYSVIV